MSLNVNIFDANGILVFINKKRPDGFGVAQLAISIWKRRRNRIKSFIRLTCFVGDNQF